MTKKHRKFKRVLALLGVVVVLASLFVIPSSAWELTDIPFYNYFDMSVVPEVHQTKSISINGVNGDEGTVTLWGDFSHSSQMKYIYSNHINRTLADICPDMTLGETYVLSVECVSVEDVGTGQGSGVSPMLQIGLSDGEQGDIWATGESRVCTTEMLSKYVYFYIGTSRDDPRYQPSNYEVTLRIWINKGEVAQDFCPYDIDKELEKDVYNKGYNDAFQEFTAKNYVFTSSTMSQVSFGFMEGTDTGKINKYTYANKEDGILYSFAGNTYNTNSFNSSYYVPPSGYNLAKIGVTFDLEDAGVDVWFGKTPLILTAKGCVVQILVFTSKSGEYSVSVDATAQPKTVDVASLFDSRMYGKKVLCVKVNVYCANEFTESSVYDSAFYATLSTGDASGYEYNLGYNAGYDAGNRIADDANYKRGLEQGYYEGYNSGTRDGYANGKEDGYYQGRSDEQEQSGFFGMISAVVDVPVRAFKSLFNFEILGTDMTSFALSIVSLSLIVAVIKMVI